MAVPTNGENERNFVLGISEMCLSSQIVQTVVERWKSVPNDGERRKFSAVMAEGLAAAGLAYRGFDAVSIHASLLGQVLELRGTSREEGESSTDSKNRCITWTEYFQVLAHPNLRWHFFLKQTLPLMHAPLACRFLENLVEHMKTTFALQEEEVTTGEVCLCASGLELGLTILLDLLLRQNCSDNEFVSPSVDSNLHHLLDLTGTCLDVLFHLLKLKSGLEACMTCDVTFKAVTHPLLLLLLVACPLLSLEASHTLLGKYLVRHAQRRSPCVELSEEERAKKRKKSLRQQREEGCKGQEGLPMTTLVLSRTKGDGADSNLTQGNGRDSAEVLDHSNVSCSPSDRIGGLGCSDKPNSLRHYCHNLISVFKSKCLTELVEKIVSFFCRGAFSDNGPFYELLAKVACDPELICIGRHQFSPQVLTEQVFPLLWYLTKQENKPYPEHCATRGTQELLDQVEKCSVLGGNCSGFPEVWKMRQRGKVFPEQLLCLHLSEADRVLASGRLLAGDTDLALLHRTVETKEHGWRDLLSLGLKNTDFQGWWKNGFFKLLWANEASLASEENVAGAVGSLCRALLSHETGSCDMWLVNDVKRLVSVMFQRLPTELQERVVLKRLDNPKACMDTQADPKGCSGGGQLLLSLLGENDLVSELTFILNRLTLDNAHQQTSFLLYLCLFHVSTVIGHLVKAAISTGAQTASVVRVLRNMPIICQRRERESDVCQLVACVSEEICKMVIDDKQIQIIANFLFMITEPYTVKSEGGTITREGSRSGILSLADILHSFVFPYFGNKSDKGIHNLDIALTTLEVFLQKAVDEKACSPQEFQPLPLMLALADSYCVNYTLLVEAGAAVEDVGQGVQVCRNRKSRRLASQRCLTLLLRLVTPAWKLFSDGERDWLYRVVCERGWLHAALLAPLLSQSEDWNNIYRSALDDLCQTMVEARALNTRRLVYLIQLALVNDVMFQEVCHRLPKLNVCLSASNLLVALKWIFSTAVTEEMAHAVHLLRLLLPLTVVDGQLDSGETIASLQPEDGESTLRGRTCESLVEASLLLVTGTDSDSLRCHGLTNYQAALQTLLSDVAPAESLTVLPTVFCLHCSLLAMTSGQAAHILQVTALDILSRFKSAVAESKRRRSGGGGGGGGGSKVGCRVKENREVQATLDSMSDCIACVEEAEVRTVLANQLREIVGS